MTERKFGEKMISLNIPLEVYENVKKSGVSHRHIYLLGYTAKSENPQLIQRINETERVNEKLQKKITELSIAIAEMKK